ncbi:Putative RNA-binding protein RbpA [Cladobotryum mycophilum]|uniref:RNA-binding protein RbpA n=1 Tax=Cladobotryum mycophilum TaxID=491253 RepID=A0ABR0SBP8_9HYPO
MKANNFLTLLATVAPAFARLYVGHLNHEVTQDDLEAFFAKYWTVKSTLLATDPKTGLSRGYGFVTLSSDSEEYNAIEAFNGAEWKGRTLQVIKDGSVENV